MKKISRQKGGSTFFTLLIIVLLIVAGYYAYKKYSGQIVKVHQQPVLETEQPSVSSGSYIERGTQEKFEKALETYNLKISQFHNQVFWSPDNRFVLLSGEKQEEGGDITIGTYLIDFANETFVPVKDDYLLSEPTWSKDYVAFASNGVYLFDLNKYEKIRASERVQAVAPIFTNDGTKLAYADQGVIVYGIATKTNTRLTDKPSDIPQAWYSDNAHIVYFRNTGTALSDGAGQTQTLSILDTTTKESKDIKVGKEKKFQTARWITQDEMLHVVAGFDDGAFDYIVRPNTGVATFIAETSDALNHIAFGQNKIFISNMKGKFTIYDYDMKKLKEFSYLASTKAADARVLMSPVFLDANRVLAYRGKKDLAEGEMLLIDTETGKSAAMGLTKAGGGKIFVSTDKKVALTLEEQKQIKFWNLP